MPDKAQRVSCRLSSTAGSIRQTDVDHYVFAAKKGTARADQLLGLAHRQSARRHADGFTTRRARNSPTTAIIMAKIPSSTSPLPTDGDYIVKVWDFVYGGGTDYFYRLHIGSLPHLDAAIPAAVRPGKKTTVTFYGRNLPGGKPAPGAVNINGRPLEMVTREIEGPDASAGVGPARRRGRSPLPGFARRDGLSAAHAGGQLQPDFSRPLPPIRSSSRRSRTTISQSAQRAAGPVRRDRHVFAGERSGLLHLRRQEGRENRRRGVRRTAIGDRSIRS